MAIFRQLVKVAVRIIFTKSRLKEKDHPNKLIVSVEPVQFSDSVKYLGVTLDSKLLWTEHFTSQLKCYDTQVGTPSWFVLGRLRSWDVMNNTAVDELSLLSASLTECVVSV